MEFLKSLAPHTGKVFEKISKLECIKPFTLVGGTALSLQIEKRQSEDLDFMKWLTNRNEKPEVNWPAIKKELEGVGHVANYEIGSLDYVTFDFEGVIISFYAAPRKAIPSMQRMIDAALEHSNHKLRTRGLLAMLTNGSRFIKEKGFEELQPVYNVSANDIQEYIKQKLLEEKK